MPRADARKLLANEARVYASMPRQLQEEWSGLNYITFGGYVVTLWPVVPKFYG
jgi:hypothetical protein